MSRAKTIGLFLVRLLGFRRPTPTTRLGRYARKSERALLAVIVLYFALICFPQPLFAYNVSKNGVTVYSRTPLPAETATRIDEALSLVRQSELAVPGRSERIFICDKAWLYHLFAAVSPGGFGISYPVSDNIFVAPSNLRENVIQSNQVLHNERNFSTVVAHEITHGLVRHRIGVLRAMVLRTWVSEGYADYIARESSFPADEGLRNLREGKDDPSGSFHYFVYQQMVRHLIEHRHYSFDDLVGRAGDFDAVKAETVAAIKEGAQP